MYRELHAALWLDPRHPLVPAVTHVAPENGEGVGPKKNTKHSIVLVSSYRLCESRFLTFSSSDGLARAEERACGGKWAESSEE